MKYRTVIDLSGDVQLSIASISGGGSKIVKVELNRISAQNLADALLQFAGATSKAAGLGRSVGIPVVDLDPPPEARPVRPVKLGPAKSGGAVYLNKPR